MLSGQPMPVLHAHDFEGRRPERPACPYRESGRRPSSFLLRFLLLVGTRRNADANGDGVDGNSEHQCAD
jgi:hypothetical protein